MTQIPLASRLDRVKPSATMAVAAKAAALRAEGVDVISFGAGEPDFDTPAHIKAAAEQALVDDCSSYTHVMGLLELREAVSASLLAAHGHEWSPADIIVSTGAKQGLFNLFMSLLNPGEQVIIPTPAWVSYPDMVKIAEGDPVLVPTTVDSGFQLDAGALEAAITPRTRAVVLNTPCNPTGALYDAAALNALAEVIVRHDLLVVSDDIYRALVYGDAEYVSIASLSPEVAARTVCIDGVSKTYAMTGWRIGFTAGPSPIIKAMAKIQGQSTSNAAHISQRAALAALTGPQDCVAQMRAAFDARRRRIVELLRAIPHVRCAEPRGAFYAFPDLSHYLGTRTATGASADTAIDDDIALCEYLVAQGKVAIVPGSAFGAPGYARLSYATSMDDINRGVTRLAEALTALS